MDTLQQNLTMKQFYSCWERDKSGITIPYMRLIDELSLNYSVYIGETDGSIVEDLLNCKNCVYM